MLLRLQVVVVTLVTAINEYQKEAQFQEVMTRPPVDLSQTRHS